MLYQLSYRVGNAPEDNRRGARWTRGPIGQSLSAPTAHRSDQPRLPPFVIRSPSPRDQRSPAAAARLTTARGTLAGRSAALLVGVATLALLAPGSTSAQPPAPAAQNPSPMVERTRAHERLEQRALPGTARAFTGPAGRPVDLWIPEGVVGRDTFDLVVHFHGASWLPTQAVAGLPRPTVAAVVNLGAGSGGYHRAFAEPAAFDSLLARAAHETARATGVPVRFTRVTLVGFSAGHGAVRAILLDPRHLARVDAVLLLDGMHTSYLPDRQVLADGGALDTTNLTALTDFARRATRGAKAMLITHSEIFPGTFASTTETADWMLAALDLRRTAVLAWGPRGMQQTSEARRGGFTLLGFAGNSAPDHVDHLHALPELLALLSNTPSAPQRP